MLRVYISSTYKDLIDHRAAAAAGIRSADCHCRGMEDYNASSEPPVDKCLADVPTCDVYVGLFAHRYGFRPYGSESITELEYRTARQHGIQRLIFIIDTQHAWLPDFVDSPGSKDGRSITKLRKELTREHNVSFFTTPDDLKQKVTAAIGQEIIRRLTEQLKARSKELSDVRGELARIESDHDDLRAAVETADALRREGSTLAAEALEDIKNQKELNTLQRVLTDDADRLKQHISETNDAFVQRCREIAAVAHLRGDNTEAEQRATLILAQCPSDVEAIDILARTKRRTGQLDQALELFQSLRDASADQPNVHASALAEISSIYFERHELKTAEKFAVRAYEMFRELRLAHPLAAVNSLVGRIYLDQGRDEEGERAILMSLAVYEELNDIQGVAAQHAVLFRTPLLKGDFEKSNEHLRKALEGFGRSGNQLGEAYAAGALGRNLLLSGRPVEAEPFVETAFKIYDKLGEMKWKAKQVEDRAAIAESRGDIEKAKGHWREARGIYKSIDHNEEWRRVEWVLDRLRREYPETTGHQEREE